MQYDQLKHKFLSACEDKTALNVSFALAGLEAFADRQGVQLATVKNGVHANDAPEVETATGEQLYELWQESSGNLGLLVWAERTGWTFSRLKPKPAPVLSPLEALQALVANFSPGHWNKPLENARATIAAARAGEVKK